MAVQAGLCLAWSGSPEDTFCRVVAQLLTVSPDVDTLELPLLLVYNIVMILSFRTDMPGQTVQTQIRLVLEEQSDQGLHCLPFCLHRLDSLLYGRAT